MSTSNPVPTSLPGAVGPPTKHQLAVMIWLAVFPTLTVLNLGGRDLRIRALNSTTDVHVPGRGSAIDTYPHVGCSVRAYSGTPFRLPNRWVLPERSLVTVFGLDRRKPW